MTRTLLVTGAAGFAGRHLLARLAGPDVTLHAWHRPEGAPPSARALPADVIWTAVDITDRQQVQGALADCRPGEIYHCAGAAHVGGAWRDSGGVLAINALGTHYLLDAADRLGLSARVLVPGSALVYGRSDELLDEQARLAPADPYGLSKLAQEMCGRHAARAGGQVLLSRAFNHTGPGQSPGFAAPGFARQIAAIEAGRAEPVLRVGNLEARRDITDVRDVVRAYAAIMERGAPGRPYNVCSGRAVAVGEILERLLALARIRVEVRTEPSLLRPSDRPVLVGDPSRLREELGWQPGIPLEQTLADLLDDWRARQI